MPLHLHLCDRNTPLCDAWEREFRGMPMVTVHLADFFSVESDIMVSSGNGFGFMDVGLDLAISLKLGWRVQERLQALLRGRHGGFLPVGQAVVIPTDDRRWPMLIAAPAMFVPTDVSETVNPYLAARAAFSLWQSLEGAESKVWHMLMPGLGTGLGRVHARPCALQMRRAYEEVILGRKPHHLSLDAAQEDYRQMITGGQEVEDREARQE